MFGKRSLVDIKKSTLKLQDPKKDLATRIKHLKIILDNVDVSEAKGLYEANFSHIYGILYDSFIQAENNLRQRELSFHLVHKAHKEELECALWMLEKVLCLLPELIHKRWQLHSLGRLLSKLLHPGNAIKLRRQAIKFFLMWYQALNENAPDYVHNMFSALVPGFSSPALVPVQLSSSIFHDTSIQQPVSGAELLPVLPPSGGEKSPENMSKFYLEALLEHMVNTVVKLEWQEKSAYHCRCFHFLLEKFKTFYLMRICPGFSQATSLYAPNLELPQMRKAEAESEFIYCRVSLIMWVANYMHHGKKGADVGPQSLGQVHGDEETQHESAHASLDSTISLQTNKTTSDDELAAQIVREVLSSSRDNINFVHEIYRQAFLINFGHVIAIRRIIAVYKDLIQMNVPEIPNYLLEPLEDASRLMEEENKEMGRHLRIRNDSYLGAIHKENLLVRAGMQNFLQLFMTHAANVFLLEVNPHIPKLLEEQTDACKRVLNIYRYMVMNTRMDSNSWEQLLLVLLQITSLVLGENPPRKKAQTLGGKLAPAIFQTLIVTWIKANLNVMISRELWDRFLQVLTSLTNWEELIKEWAKTMETLTRVLARHVYNLDLTDLPLEQRSKRGRKTTTKPESHVQGNVAEHLAVSRQDSSIPDGNVLRKRAKPGLLTRSLSETNLSVKRRTSPGQRNHKHRRSMSLDALHQLDSTTTESTDRTRSPSPAPSSGLESNSIKDSPIQLDVLSAVENAASAEAAGEHRGIVCGGTIRGWLPDVAVVLWRRMLGALGDVNGVQDAKLHAQIFDYLVKLTETLIKIQQNQGISTDNQSTPLAPELVPPITLILPWCFGALMLPESYENGKLQALRLLCTITLNCDRKHRNHLPQFYRFLHTALSGACSRAYLNTTLKHLGPRFLSLQLPGASLLLLDLIHGCNAVLSSMENLESAPRTEAISIVANLLSLSGDNLSGLSVLQPAEDELHVMSCPPVKEHVVGILLRAGRREQKGKARCIALSALGMFVYKELSSETFNAKVPDALNVILLALKFNNKVIAQLASNILLLLCDYASLLWTHYPRLGVNVIRTLCAALCRHAPLGTTAGDNDKALGTALLLCLGEWCMRLEPKRLLEVADYGEQRDTCLLLEVFTVLYEISTGKTSSESSESGIGSNGGLSQPSLSDDFDPNILSDDLNPKPTSSPTSPSSIHADKGVQNHRAMALCARTVLAHLVTYLGHFPMAIGAARLSSLVVEHDDVPNLVCDELSANIFAAPNIQLFMLNRHVISSLIELPALEMPGGGVTAGLATADKQVRVLLRDLSGKACWDASILYRGRRMGERSEEGDAKRRQEMALAVEAGGEQDVSGVGLGEPLDSFVMGVSSVVTNLPQRAMRHRPKDVLPDAANAAPDLDQLDDLLQYLGYTSPECLESFDRKLNEPTPSPLSLDVEQEAIGSVINQRTVELEDTRTLYQQHLEQIVSRPGSVCTSHDSTHCDNNAAFQQCRLLFSQMGLAGWERRKQLHLLKKSERLLRELRNLDGQRCRETHKVAVIYVAPGQEDKNSILSNQGGSAAYEQFLAALAWEIELEGHTGFLGGLHRQGSTGLTAPYVATSFSEVIFHVATRMLGDSSEAVLNKTRHLGNDEVHIVWSEHCRDYRRDIIPTEFCDILITIYPLSNHLNRVTVNCKPNVPHFGILFHESIVESNVLAGLVRATVICASRAERSTRPYYKEYYEERAISLETVVTNHKSSTTFEEFVSKVYSPIATPSPFCASGSTGSGAGDGPGCAGNHSMLAAALLDSNGGHSHNKPNQIREDLKCRVGANESARGVWFNQTTDMSQNVESTSISPRPLKKISTSLKNVPRRSLRQDHPHESPPDSPQQGSRRK